VRENADPCGSRGQKAWRKPDLKVDCKMESWGLHIYEENQLYPIDVRLDFSIISCAPLSLFATPPSTKE
jgi:hypothetical protein